MASLDLSDMQLDGVREKITGFIIEAVGNAGASGVVVGVSGGLDSAVVLALAKEAGADVKALILPEGGLTPKEDVDDAEALAKEIGVDYKTVDIKEIVDAFVKQVGETSRKRALGNVKARVRMILLYLCANEENRLVLGASNKSELLLGYFTKHGDGGADVLPIGGLYKTQVRALARKIGVPERILDKPPSAGLWAGQTDEGELGLEYAKIDEILRLLYDVVAEEEAIAGECGVSAELVREIADRVKRSRHKTLATPIADLGEIIG